MSNPKPPVLFQLPKSMRFHQLETSDTFSISMKFRCESALDALERGDRASAKRYLLAAKDLDPDFSDIWVFLAGLAETAQEQEQYLESALAYEPNNPLAFETLAILRGKVKPMGAPSPLQHADPQQAVYKEIQCPQCKGKLRYNTNHQEVTCHFCGFLVLDSTGMPRAAEKPTALALGMLNRKTRAADWNIGSRWLQCNNCGAHTTISRQTITNTCRFCDSRHVVEVKADTNYEQPDAILPFSVDEAECRRQIELKLKSGVRMLTRFFADPIKDIKLNAVYLPFWVFDAEMNVRYSWSNIGGGGDYPVLLADVLYFAAETPSRRLLDEIEPFYLEHAVSYDPRLLSSHPAELYKIDVDQASIDVRTKFVKLANNEARMSTSTSTPHEYDYMGNRKDPGDLRLNPMTKHMSYRFVLLPVLIGALEEVDGDTRQLLVNGQTGEVALGKLVKL